MPYGLLLLTRRGARDTAAAFTTREWLRLAVGCGLCLAACDALAVLARVPAQPGFDGSLLAAPGAAVGFAVAVAAVVAGLVLGLLAAGPMGVEAVVFCAAIGLAALAVRCGPITPVLQYAAGRGVFAAMLLESVLLVAALAGGWWALERLARAARDRAAGDDVIRLGFANEVEHPTLAQRFTVLGVAVLVTGVCEMIFVHTPAAKQAVAGVIISSFLGSLAAYTYTPIGEGIWFWTAPAATGAVGYGFAFAGHDGGPLGQLRGFAAALARPTPLDYASVGTAFALLGHWTSRRWAQAEEPQTLADPEAPPA